MRKQILTLFLLIASLQCFSQIPKGRYFEDIQGTVWMSEDLNDSTIFTLNQIALRIWEKPVDSLEYNATIWFFDEKLTIKNYNKVKDSYQTIFICNYNLNKEQRLLTLVSNNKDKPELKFTYSTISTGSHVFLTRDKPKRKKRRN